MKKILLGLLILILAALGALAAFLMTFDLNRYRPMITEKASQALGAPVEIGRLSLVLKKGIALRVQDIVVYTNDTPRTSSAKLKEARVSVKLAPLLRKEIEVTSIVLLEPEAVLVKTPNGKVGLKGSNPASTPAASANSTSGGKTAAPAISIRLFQVRGGKVRFQDPAAVPPLDITVKNIDVDVKDFSLTDPFSFVLQASLFSAKQNLMAQGNVTLPKAGKDGSVKDALFKTDLGSLNLNELERAFPSAGAAGLEELKGVLETKIDRFDMGAAPSADAALTLEKGYIKLKTSKSALGDISFKGALAGEDLKIETLSADYAGGKVKASGIVKQFRTQPFTGLTWSSRDLAMEEMMPESGRGPKLSGRVSLDFEGQGAGKSWPQLAPTLTGQGRFALKDGVLLNYNLLRTVVEKLSMVPGAEEALRNNLPNIYKAKMNEPSTVLQPIEVPFTIQNGQVYLSRIDLVTDFILVNAAGQVGLDKRVALRANVRIHQQLTQAIVSVVPNAQIIMNAQGELEVPGQIQGVLPSVTFVPDTDYLVQKLLSSEAAQKLISGFIKDPNQGVSQFRNLLDKPVAAGESGAQNSLAGLLQAFGQSKSQPAASGTENQ